MDNSLPISAARAVFLADAHLNQDDIHSRRFLQLAEQAASENVPMYLLGDVFDLWFGSPGLTFAFQRPIIERLRDLRREGLRLTYVEGNRDFYLKREHEGTTFDTVSEADLQAMVGQKRVYLSHGDTVNRADFSYRFWKGISKSRAANRGVAYLPPKVFLPAAEWIERRLKRSNRRYKGSFPEKECREFALRLFVDGVDFIVLGHFHHERLMRFSRGKSTRVVAVLPSWKDRWRYFHLASDGNFGFRTYDPAKPLVPPGPPAPADPGRSL
jgi:UDP-2,3-diacylglucosamine hydrolase